MRLHERAALPGAEQEIMAARPACDGPMDLAIDCWHSLEGDRPLGVGAVGMIPFSAIDTWARRRRVDGPMFDVLEAVIRRLDGERMEREASERALRNGGR